MGPIELDAAFAAACWAHLLGGGPEPDPTAFGLAPELAAAIWRQVRIEHRNQE
jgi:hypothetical protein